MPDMAARDEKKAGRARGVSRSVVSNGWEWSEVVHLRCWKLRIHIELTQLVAQCTHAVSSKVRNELIWTLLVE